MAVGAGAGVAVGEGVGVDAGVSVGVVVDIGAVVEVGEAVGDGFAVGVAVDGGAGVDEDLGKAAGVKVGAGVAAAAGVALGVAVGTGGRVGVAVAASSSSAALAGAVSVTPGFPPQPARMPAIKAANPTDSRVRITGERLRPIPAPGLVSATLFLTSAGTCGRTIQHPSQRARSVVMKARRGVAGNALEHQAYPQHQGTGRPGNSRLPACATGLCWSRNKLTIHTGTGTNSNLQRYPPGRYAESNRSISLDSNRRVH